MACFLVVLSLLGEWIWTDASHQISMGLDFYSYDVYGGGGTEDAVFLDLDADGDLDMVRLISYNNDIILKASENISNADQILWQDNPELLSGINTDSIFNDVFGMWFWLSNADLDGDGNQELILGSDGDCLAYVNKGEGDSPFWEANVSLLDLTDVCQADFADVDGDGDLDMVGLWLESWDEGMMCLWWNTGTVTNPDWEQDTTYFGYDPWEGRFKGDPSWIDWNEDGIVDVIYTLWGFADPLPYWGGIYVMINEGTPTSPQWSEDFLFEGYILGYLTLLDWNADNVPDIFMQGDYYDGGYHYVQGTRAAGEITYEFYRPRLWGGITGEYPAVADTDDDGIPEIAVTEQCYHMGLEGGSNIVSYYFMHLRRYSSENQGRLWQETGHGCCWHYSGYSDGHMQYVDFNNDGLEDYVINTVYGEGSIWGRHELYINRGTKTEPQWEFQIGALSDLPPLLPSCFIDIDHDGDLDVIGVLVFDGTLTAYNNRGGSRENPTYGRYDRLISGLEGLEITYMSPCDLNADGIDDLAVGLSGGGSGGGLTACINYYSSLGHWVRNDEVFAGIDGGNPCLADGDGDGDLDLYLSRGRLRYYVNESTEGIAEPFARSSFPSVLVTGSTVEIKVPLASGLSTGASLSVYNAAGQRVRCMFESALGGEVCFRFSQQPGIYFYRIQAGDEASTGKLVIAGGS